MLACSPGPTWVTYAIEIALLISALLAIVVMQKADQDQQINRIDSLWIRKSRRLSFISIAFCAFITIITDVSPLALLSLFASAGVLLLIDVIALENRPPRRGRSAFAGSVERGAPLRHIRAFMRKSIGER